MPKRNLLSAVWQGRCPRCRQGFIFKESISALSRFSEMNERCAQCSASFIPEPGFYFGALYVSYAFTVALFVGIWLFFYVLFDPADWVYIVAIIIGSVLIIPFSFRYSRILFLYWFGGLNYEERD